MSPGGGEEDDEVKLDQPRLVKRGLSNFEYVFKALICKTLAKKSQTRPLECYFHAGVSRFAVIAFSTNTCSKTEIGPHLTLHNLLDKRRELVFRRPLKLLKLHSVL